ncbi:MAG: hypothetical protein U0231_07940 [Nitrospiraceae bacterium]
MANPPMERPNSRREFQHLLQALEITEGALEEEVRLWIQDRTERGSAGCGLGSAY